MSKVKQQQRKKKKKKKNPRTQRPERVKQQTIHLRPEGPARQEGEKVKWVHNDTFVNKMIN
jgi:hypothetical protein